MIKNHILYTNFLDWKFKMKKADGAYIWDQSGHKLIDFTSGWNVANLGWNNPEITQAIISQAGENHFVPMWLSDETQEEYAAELISSLPDELNVIVRATGGTDANEKALLLARTVTGRKKVLGFFDTYHGHSFGTVSIGYRPEYSKDVAPIVPEFIKMDFPSTYLSNKSEEDTLNDFLNNLEEILKHRDVAALVTESGIITGWGSTFVAPSGYLSGIRKLTKQYNTLLVLDEVGTGFSRCGKLFGMELENVVPDVVTFAKGISNGAGAIGAVALSDKYGEKELSAAKTHSTFGWMPVDVAAARTVLKIHKRDRVWEQAKTKGDYLLSELKKKLTGYESVGTVQGKGMEIGVLFVTDKKTRKPNDGLALKIVDYAYKQGLHLAFGGDGNIQIMPPLIISKKDLDVGIEIISIAIKNAAL